MPPNRCFRSRAVCSLKDAIPPVYLDPPCYAGLTLMPDRRLHSHRMMRQSRLPVLLIGGENWSG